MTDRAGGTDGADGADGADGPGPTRVDRIGPLGALLLYFSSAMMGLCGPVMLACTFLADAGILLGGILCTVLCTPLGLAFWAYTSTERENNRLLDAFGVRATAEITDLTPWEDADDAGVVAALRISGPGFPTFETTWKHSLHSGLRVGVRLTAVVDPARNLFRIDGIIS